MSVILALNMLRQEDHKFEVRLEYRIRPCLQKQKTKQNKKNPNRPGMEG